jgi:hypothetical protein
LGVVCEPERVVGVFGEIEMLRAEAGIDELNFFVAGS